MHEPDVTLTDYGLTLECALLAFLLSRAKERDLLMKRAGVGFFAFMGLSAALGGTVHGFCPDLGSTACRVLWQWTLQAIGLSAVSMWWLGSSLIFSGRSRWFLGWVAAPLFVLYSAAALALTQQFWIAFTIYIPAAILLLAGFGVRLRGDPRAAGVGAAGSLLSFVSSAIQFTRTGLHPVYFNHNALAHVVQAVALWLLFLGISGLARRAPSSDSGSGLLPDDIRAEAD